MERGPIQLTLTLPEGASVTVTNRPQALRRPVSVIDPIDPKTHYPKEATANPSLIREFVQAYKDFGPDYEQTEDLFSKIAKSIKTAKRRGFSFERYEEDLDSTLLETRQQFEGYRMGKEPEVIAEIRERITELALNIYEGARQNPLKAS